MNESNQTLGQLVYFPLPDKADAICAWPTELPNVFHIFSPAPLQPNPRDYVEILQKMNRLPAGQTNVEELGPQPCVQLNGEACVRVVTRIELIR